MKYGFAAAALMMSATTAAAQLPSIFPAHSDYIDPWYPVVYYSPADGFAAGGYWGIVRPLPYDAPSYAPPYEWSTSIKGRATTRGTRVLDLEGHFPATLEGWRLEFKLSARRMNRSSYFGTGNQSVFDSDLETDSTELYYRARRVRTFGRGEVQRRIYGPVWLLAGLHLERWRIEPIDSTASQVGQDLAGGAPGLGTPTNDFAGRVGLAVDTRNDEVSPRSGVLLEAIVSRADASVAGDVTYTRTTVSARGYLPLSSRFFLAGRVMGQDMTGDAPVGSLYLVESARSEFEGIGGPRSHRGLRTNRLLGRGKLLANVELRYDLYEYPSLIPPVTFFGFFDAGRVFHGQDDFRITLDDMQVGGGAGVMVQVGRAGIFGFSMGVGPDGFRTDFQTGWTF